MLSTLLSDEQTQTLVSVLDTIVPQDAERGMPGAGQLGVADYVEQALSENSDLVPVVAAGLSALIDRDFAALEPAARVDALNEVAASQPGFLPLLVFQTYQGYYQNPGALEALGLPPRPPHPLGYEMEESDLSLLDPVVAREKLYRDV